MKDDVKYWMSTAIQKGKFKFWSSRHCGGRNEKQIDTVHQPCSHRCAFLMLKYPCEFPASHDVMGDNKF
jgi:hypothetical protein